MASKKRTPFEGTMAPRRALPAEWYTSEAMYQLERRAIFSKRWLITTHKARIPKPGTWQEYEIAGFHMVLVHDTAGNYKAFRNVAGNSASSILKNEQDLTYLGSRVVLVPIHVHIDRVGFLWVNFDRNEEPEYSWDDDFLGVDTQARYAPFNFDDYDYDHTWELEADYNWKIAADNWNECYHCKTTHPDITATMDISSHSIDFYRSWQHHNSPPKVKGEGEVSYCSSYLWPNVSITVAKNLIYTQRFVPRGPQKTMVIYEVFRSKTVPESEFGNLDHLFKRVMTEDKALCVAAQQNIARGVFVNGELHPIKEKGPLFFQSQTRVAVKDHVQQEHHVGHQIWPAGPEVPSVPMTKGSGTGSHRTSRQNILDGTSLLHEATAH